MAEGTGAPARLRLVFFGHARYSLVLLQRLRHVSGVDVVGLVSRAAGPMYADFCSLVPIAKHLGIPCLAADDVPEDGWAAWLSALNADVGYAIGWSPILGRSVIDAFPLGIVGYHPAPLPRNRGHHPIVWALALGLDETASTLFLLDEDIDSGDIVSQERVTITADDDAGTLYAKLAATVGRQIEQVTAELLSGRLKRVPQDHSRRSVWRRRGYPDGRIDWRMSATSIHNLVRALTRPYVGAHCVIESRDVRIWRTRLPDRVESPRDIEPGRVLAVADGRVVVKCGEGELEIVEHELDRLPRVGACLP